MSYEAWGDGDDGHESCRTDEHVRESFVTGAQAMREMLARFVEQGGDHSTAASIRANWAPSWGPDPGRLTGTLPTPGDDPPIAPRSETALARPCPPVVSVRDIGRAGDGPWRLFVGNHGVADWPSLASCGPKEYAEEVARCIRLALWDAATAETGSEGS